MSDRPAAVLSSTPPIPPGVVAIRHVWVCNSPKAGSGMGRDQLAKLPGELERRGLHVHLVSDIERLAHEVADRHGSYGDAGVVAAGGDGTLSLVAQHVAPEVPIMPMPMGTENLVARHYGFDRSAERVAATLVRGERFRIDAGRANGRLFLVMITAGFDAEVVRAMHLTRRGHIYRWHYVGPLLRACRRYAFGKMTAEFLAAERSTDERFNAVPPPQVASQVGCWMMAFNLPRYAASLSIEPGALADDGLLHHIVFPGGSVLDGCRYAAGIFRGRHLTAGEVQRNATARVLWTSPKRVPYQIDGDYAGRLPVLIECLPQRVTFLRPAK